jgi:hypothetical protein
MPHESGEPKRSELSSCNAFAKPGATVQPSALRMLVTIQPEQDFEHASVTASRVD